MSKTLATSYFMQTNGDTDTARRELYRYGVKTSYSDKVMIFTTQHNAKNTFNNPYIQECNGLVLEKNTWRPLVVPPRTLRFNINTEASNKFLHQGLYHIYRVQDGTCFNMYYYNDAWVISTTRGHTMNDVKWAQDKTYQQIIVECLERIGLTWDTFTSQLSKTNCYSFGFKHPLMQKFREGSSQDIYRIWFIQSVCIKEDDAAYLWSSDTCPIAIIPTQEILSDVIGNLKELYKKATNALQDYLDNGNVCYGFILRSVNVAETLDHSDLFIESSLMRTIRKTWYENSLIDLCHKSNWDKELVITLHAYLDSPNYEVFQKLFPNYQEALSSYHTFINELVNNMATKTLSANTSDVMPNEKLVNDMLQSFRDNIKIDTKGQTNATLTKTYFEYVCHPESLNILLVHAIDHFTQIIMKLRTFS